MEYAVFNPIGDTDMKDLPDHAPVHLKAGPDMDIQVSVPQAQQQDKTGGHPRYQGCKGRPCHSPAEDEYENRIPYDIYHIHDNGCLHGNL